MIRCGLCGRYWVTEHLEAEDLDGDWLTCACGELIETGMNKVELP